MIISVSRRTDIPAFYSDWMANRIKEGFVLVRNPMNIHQISRIPLNPSTVDCFVFWTKNPERFLENLSLFSKYNYYFQFTLTPYDQRLEPNVISKSAVLDVFKKLSSIVGKKRVIWRYDPILITEELSCDWHIKQFAHFAKQLSGSTGRCVISFIDLYKKCEKNLYGIKLTTLTPQLMRDFTRSIAVIASNYGIELVSCAEEIDLSEFGVAHGKCIDDKLIAEIAGCDVVVSKDKSQRAECGCVASVDIGAYNSCPHGCLYCYANNDLNAVRFNYAKHNPNSPLLFGEVEVGDRITDRKSVSCFDLQRRLFK
jgi:hypothetical protein